MCAHFELKENNAKMKWLNVLNVRCGDAKWQRGETAIKMVAWTISIVFSRKNKVAVASQPASQPNEISLVELASIINADDGSSSALS